MGLLSTLGKLGAGIAAPFTGGLSTMAIPAIDALGSIGKVAGGAAKGAADQRSTDAQLALQRFIAESTQNNNAAQFGQTQARDAFNTGLQGSQFGASEQQRGMRNALVAQLMGGMQDAKFTGGSGRIPNVSVTGGLKPSTLDAGGLGGFGAGATNTGITGGQIGPRAALMSQLTQPTMQAPTYTPGAAMPTTPMPQAPTAGMGEKILGGVGLGGSLLGILGGLFNKKQGVPTFGNAPSGITAPRTA